MNELEFTIEDWETVSQFHPKMPIYSLDVVVWVDMKDNDYENASFDCSVFGIGQDGEEYDLGYSGTDFFGLGITDEDILKELGL